METVRPQLCDLGPTEAGLTAWRSNVDDTIQLLERRATGKRFKGERRGGAGEWAATPAGQNACSMTACANGPPLSYTGPGGESTGKSDIFYPHVDKSMAIHEKLAAATLFRPKFWQA